VGAVGVILVVDIVVLEVILIIVEIFKVVVIVEIIIFEVATHHPAPGHSFPAAVIEFAAFAAAEGVLMLDLFTFGIVIAHVAAHCSLPAAGVPSTAGEKQLRPGRFRLYIATGFIKVKKKKRACKGPKGSGQFSPFFPLRVQI
jgi:hypothetical protein